MQNTNSSTGISGSPIVLLGQSGVGKTSLFIRLTGGDFSANESTHGGGWPGFPQGQDSTRLSIFAISSEKSPVDIISSMKEIGPSIALVLVDLTRGSELRDEVAKWKAYLIDSGVDRTAVQMLVGTRMDIGPPSGDLSLKRLADEFRFSRAFQTSAKTAEGVQELRSAVVEATRSRDDEAPIDSVARIMHTMAEALCRLVAVDPGALNRIEWRELERIVATALDVIGFRVELTPGSQDGGKDVVAHCVVSDQDSTFYVEIKHWRKGDRPGPRHVLDFVELNAREGTTGGLFLSSSGFTDSVYSRLGEISKQTVRLGEREKIVSLCQHFVRRKEGTWHPARPLPELLFEDTYLNGPGGLRRRSLDVGTLL